ncbi:unnamed protein product [Dovyalis caffra]|uniref:Uncharacterized protein n=1 Tax=Dovyalis caffra TaxID=77055 RepID=A0AAV1QX57_9ROSI|nr:unnamed protein product [Dovyalis caffra]
MVKRVANNGVHDVKKQYRKLSVINILLLLRTNREGRKNGHHLLVGVEVVSCGFRLLFFYQHFSTQFLFSTINNSKTQLTKKVRVHRQVPKLTDGFEFLILIIGCEFISQGVDNHRSNSWRVSVSGGVRTRKALKRGEVEFRSIEDEEVVKAEGNVEVGPSIVVPTMRCL